MRPSLLPDRVYAEVRGFQWHRDSKYGGDASLQIVRNVGTRESVDGHRSATEPGRATGQAAPGVRGCALRSYLRFRAARCGDSVEPLIVASTSLEDRTWW
jgi:hypothetical protein